MYVRFPEFKGRNYYVLIYNNKKIKYTRFGTYFIQSMVRTQYQLCYSWAETLRPFKNCVCVSVVTSGDYETLSHYCKPKKLSVQPSAR